MADQNEIKPTALLHACALVMPQWPDRLTAWRALVNSDLACAAYYASVNTHANADHRDSSANYLRMACAIARASDSGLTVVIQS